MAGKEKGEQKKTPKAVKKLTLNEMPKAVNESYPIIVGSLVKGGLQGKMESEQKKIRKNLPLEGMITKAELKRLVSDFKGR